MTDCDSERYRDFLEFLPDPVYVVAIDKTVTYLNPAFEKIFGWSLSEIRGRRFPFVPEHLKEQTRQVVQRLFRDRVVHGFETQRLTREGRVLDVVVDGAVLFDRKGRPLGQVMTFRDVTRQKQLDRSNQALFRIAKALHQFRGLEKRLAFITRQVQDQMDVEGAIVILVDERKGEFFFRAAAYDDAEAEKKYKETRYPLDRGVAGEVFRSGQPMIVDDYYNSPFFVEQVDRQIGFHTRSMLQVPIWTEERIIGTLCVVNKRAAPFEQADVDLAGTIASIVALPIVNARINEELENSYEEVKSLNRAKDRVIHHLSHELKTPVSVLEASLNLLAKKLGETGKDGTGRILDRARRNLLRILEMQYQIEDMLREKDYTSYRMMSTLLEACTDELETLIEEQFGDLRGFGDRLQNIRRHLETVFGPRETAAREIRLDSFVEQRVRALRGAFSHRRCRVVTQLSQAPPITIPADVLGKIVDGLLRNAVENTPDGGRIVVAVGMEENGPFLTVSDFGVGLTREKRRLIFENFFTAYETLQYASKRPFDFNAGGKGFDLLRMKIFSERYDFSIQMKSKRCRHIPRDGDSCPGDIRKCEFCRSDVDCIETGGTMVRISFHAAGTKEEQGRKPPTGAGGLTADR